MEGGEILAADEEAEGDDAWAADARRLDASL